MFGILMLFDMALLAYVAYKYTYVDTKEDINDSDTDSKNSISDSSSTIISEISSESTDIVCSKSDTLDCFDGPRTRKISQHRKLSSVIIE